MDTVLRRPRGLGRAGIAVLGFTVAGLLLSGCVGADGVATAPKTVGGSQRPPGFGRPLEGVSPEPQREQPAPERRAPGESPADITYVVNKSRPVPADYVPNFLVVPQQIVNPAQQLLDVRAAVAATEMSRAAAVQTGDGFALCSGYRSYADQEELYSSLAASNGQEYADTYAARPGHSEHQLGLAMDIAPAAAGCGTGVELNSTAVGEYLLQHAHEYGFILRYPPDSRAIVGYAGESWHWRYVGVKVASEMHRDGIATLEEYFGLSPASEYAAG